MITEDKIAAATIAQIFGSELLHAQQNARTDGGSVPAFVTIHPHDILGKTEVSANVKSQREKQLLEMLQREAEAACPLPEQPISHTTPQQITPPTDSLTQPIAPVQQNIQPIVPLNQQKVVSQVEIGVWERINFNLERIATRLENLDLSAKKRRVKKKLQ